jgi:6-hydroxycyclohex-1-ene-1-carbonyl-CoA dehydrogenase
VRGSHLGVVGYTPEKLSLHLSRLMALDARAEGNWGCAPTRYPEILKLIESGRIAIEPFVEPHPLSQINMVLTEMMEHRLHRRAILVPDFS